MGEEKAAHKVRMGEKTRAATRPSMLLIDRVYQELYKKGFYFKEGGIAATSGMIFHLGVHYHRSVLDGNRSSNSLTCSTAARAGIENLGDYVFITKDRAKMNDRSGKYMARLEKLHDVIKENQAGSAGIKELNSWTSASIIDRVNLLNRKISDEYDLLSFFVHPNPATISYIVVDKYLYHQLDKTIEISGLVLLQLIEMLSEFVEIESTNKTEISKIKSLFTLI